MKPALEPGLYAVTDPLLLPGEALVGGVEAALRGGATLVQYRDKLADRAARERQARELLACCRAYGRPLIINDDVALALAIAADGVHLGQDDGDPAAARAALGPHRLLGVTCHASLTLARKASAAGCDYVAFGRFYGSRTKRNAPAAPLSVLVEAQTLGLPCTAIGGITLETAGEVAVAGADLVAVVNGLFATADGSFDAGTVNPSTIDSASIEARARRFTQIIHAARASRCAAIQEPTS